MLEQNYDEQFKSIVNFLKFESCFVNKFNSLKGPPGAQCSALSFSQHAPGTGPATVLAVHWQWKGKGSEVWTYPVFFLSQRLLEKNPAVIYSEQNWF